MNPLLEVIEAERLEALYVLALTTGLRRGELLALCWEDIDLGSLGKISRPGSDYQRNLDCLLEDKRGVKHGRNGHRGPAGESQP